MIHTHPCPQCKLLFTCVESGDACRYFIEDQVKRYCGKRKRRHKVTATGLHTCIHCGETELADADMEPMRDGLPSECCQGCFAQYKESVRTYNDEQIQRASRITGRPRLELISGGLFE